MKTSILKSSGLKLAIFGLALALPAISAQAQKKYSFENDLIEQAAQEAREAKELANKTKIYPSIQEMIDGGIFTETTEPSTQQINEVLVRLGNMELTKSILEKRIKSLESKGDHPVLDRLKKQLQEHQEAYEILSRQLTDFEHKGKNEYDAMSEEKKKDFEIKAQMATYEKFTEINKVEDLKQSKEKGVQFPIPFHHTSKKKPPKSDTVDLRKN